MQTHVDNLKLYNDLSWPVIPKIITFEADEIRAQPKGLTLSFNVNWAIDFEDKDKLQFKINGKLYTYKKVFETHGKADMFGVRHD